MERFAEAGADVVVHYHRNKNSAELLVEKLSSQGMRTLLVGGDLTNQDDVDFLFQQAIEAYGKVDILINNAGIYPVSPLVKIEIADWQSVMDANLTSAFLCTQAAARQMIKQESGGVIVNISSIEAVNPTPLHAHYCAAKAALEQFSRISANELGAYGIRVNAVAPGLIWTEGIEENWPEGVERWLKAVPIKRLGMPVDIADACLFLASPSASWISGACLAVDGGMLTSQVY